MAEVVLFPSKVFPVLWHLVCDDVFKVWEICPIFQKCNALHVIIADPIEVLPSRFCNHTFHFNLCLSQFGPCRITRITEGQPMV